jgi:hypothetical protein
MGILCTIVHNITSKKRRDFNSGYFFVLRPGCEKENLLRGAGEAVGDGAPSLARGRGFDHDEGRAGFVALVELGVKGARERFGVVGERGHPAKITGQQDRAVGYDANLLGRKIKRLKLGG